MARFFRKILTTISIMTLTGSSFVAGVAYGVKTNITEQFHHLTSPKVMSTAKGAALQIQKKLPVLCEDSLRAICGKTGPKKEHSSPSSPIQENH